MSQRAAESADMTTRGKMEQVARAVPFQVAIAAMAVVGIGIAVYLTIEHYGKVPLVCSSTGLVDCASVLTSPYAVVPGTQIPITVPGLLWFIVSGGMAGIAISAAWRNVAPPARLLDAQRVWGGFGILTILYLVFVEIVKVHRICAWCTGVHVLVLATFCLTLLMTEAAPMPAPAKRAKAKADAAPARAAAAAAPDARSAARPVTRPVAAKANAAVAAGTSRPTSAHGGSRKHRSGSRRSR